MLLATLGCASIGHGQSDDEGRAWGPAPPGTPHPFLPREFEIEHQVIRVAFERDRHAVNGLTDIRLRAVTGPLHAVTLDAVGLTVASVRDLANRALVHHESAQTLSVTFASPLAKGASETIRIAYAAVRPRAGVYFVDQPRVVWTQGRLEDNRFWTPTVNGASARATWDLFITTDSDERAFSNGRLAGSRAVANGIEWHWVQDWAIPLQYMTLAVGPYAALDDSAGAVKLQYWAYRDSLDAARKSFAVTPRVVEILQRKLNTPLPDSHFAQGVVPDFIFWDLLEQWRPLIATSVQDARLLLSDQQWRGENHEMTIARMVAQEWFGKSLAPRDWSELWLSDGFINFMAQVYYAEAHGVDAVAPIRQDSRWSVAAYDHDARRPLIYDRWMYGPMELLLTEHASQRGAEVLQLLRHDLGDSVFWRGMHEYVTSYAGRPVTTADFRNAMEKASGRDLGLFFRQWVSGAGYPYLRIAYAYDSAARRLTLTIRQVQRRDEWTGFFDANVDVAIGTAHDVVRATVPLHGETTTYAITVPSDPLYILWDPDKVLPSDVQFPRPTALLIGQLDHASRAGRLDALVGLSLKAQAGMNGGFTGTNAPPVADVDAMLAILRVARSDTSLAVREEAITSTMGLYDASARAALIAFTHDTSPEIRAVAAQMLFGPPYPESRARLRVLADSDPSPAVRWRAAHALSMMFDFAPLQRIANAVMRSDTTSDAQRAGAAGVLADPFVPGAWEVGKRYLTAPSSSRAVRQAVIREMGIAVNMRFNERANPEEFIALMRPFLASDDPSLRLAAVRECGGARTPEARQALEELKATEVDARVLREIDHSLAELAKPAFPGFPPGGP